MTHVLSLFKNVSFYNVLWHMEHFICYLVEWKTEMASHWFLKWFFSIFHLENSGCYKICLSMLIIINKLLHTMHQKYHFTHLYKKTLYMLLWNQLCIFMLRCHTLKMLLQILYNKLIISINFFSFSDSYVGNQILWCNFVYDPCKFINL